MRFSTGGAAEEEEEEIVVVVEEEVGLGRRVVSGVALPRQVVKGVPSTPSSTVVAVQP